MYDLLTPLNNPEWILKLYFCRAGLVPCNQEEIHKFQLLPEGQRTTHPAIQLLRPTTQVTGTKTPSSENQLELCPQAPWDGSKQAVLNGYTRLHCCNSLRIHVEKERKNIHDQVTPWK